MNPFREMIKAIREEKEKKNQPKEEEVFISSFFLKYQKHKINVE